MRVAGALLRQWARLSGGVLVIDHSTDKADNPSGHPLEERCQEGDHGRAILWADRETLWMPMADCRTMIMLGKDRHAGLRPHSEPDPTGGPKAFTRMARLKLSTTLEGGELRILLPPSFGAEPTTEQQQCRGRQHADDECPLQVGTRQSEGLGDLGPAVKTLVVASTSMKKAQHSTTSAFHCRV